jgi:hypothetical protein
MDVLSLGELWYTKNNRILLDNRWHGKANSYRGAISGK